MGILSGCVFPCLSPALAKRHVKSQDTFGAITTHNIQHAPLLPWRQLLLGSSGSGLASGKRGHREMAAPSPAHRAAETCQDVSQHAACRASPLCRATSRKKKGTKKKDSDLIHEWAGMCKRDEYEVKHAGCYSNNRAHTERLEGSQGGEIREGCSELSLCVAEKLQLLNECKADPEAAAWASG